ncbi:MAG: methyltransferase regulatory domain-containing protein [Hyphomicrobiales bacterium]
MQDLRDTFAEAVSRTSRQYDAVPYTSLPVTRLQPARLTALARLFGLAAPDVEKARVLEIGCASGGHLIPLAAAFPGARFLGIDVSPLQIADGLARIARLGLHNIELQTRSLTELGLPDGQFDYVICHGVYSWIPPAIREILLRACKERLAPDGIAAVSYNVLPGWRLLQAVRDCVLLHAGDHDDHATRMAETRRLFQLMTECTPEATAYGRLWRQEAQRMARNTDAYLAHELFEEHNAPSTFKDFMAAASHHGLAYLCEAQLMANIPESGGPVRGRLVRELAVNGLHAAEQYTDIVTGRTFRQSLLIHEGRAADADRSLPASRADGLHFVAPTGMKIEHSPETGRWSIDDGDGTISETGEPAVAAALQRLAARLPSSGSLDEIAPAENTGQEDRGKIRASLMQLLCHGSLEAATVPVICAAGLPERPKVWPLAASDGAAGMEHTATLRHAAFAISPQARFLLPLADGTRDRPALIDCLLQFVLGGGVSISETGVPVTDPDRLRAICTNAVDGELAAFARVGLLVEN